MWCISFLQVRVVIFCETNLGMELGTYTFTKFDSNIGTKPNNVLESCKGNFSLFRRPYIYTHSCRSSTSHLLGNCSYPILQGAKHHIIMSQKITDIHPLPNSFNHIKEQPISLITSDQPSFAKKTLKYIHI